MITTGWVWLIKWIMQHSRLWVRTFSLESKNSLSRTTFTEPCVNWGEPKQPANKYDVFAVLPKIQFPLLLLAGVWCVCCAALDHWRSSISIIRNVSLTINIFPKWKLNFIFSGRSFSLDTHLVSIVKSKTHHILHNRDESRSHSTSDCCRINTERARE